MTRRILLLRAVLVCMALQLVNARVFVRDGTGALGTRLVLVAAVAALILVILFFKNGTGKDKDR